MYILIVTKRPSAFRRPPRPSCRHDLSFSLTRHDVSFIPHDEIVAAIMQAQLRDAMMRHDGSKGVPRGRRTVVTGGGREFVTGGRRTFVTGGGRSYNIGRLTT